MSSIVLKISIEILAGAGGGGNSDFFDFFLCTNIALSPCSLSRPLLFGAEKNDTLVESTVDVKIYVIYCTLYIFILMNPVKFS